MRWSAKKWLLLLLALLTLAAFWQVSRNDFVNYDDPDYVTGNAYVQQGLTWSGVKWAFGNLHGQATYWHPLTWLSHMLDYQLFGLNASAHHLVNLLFHTANVLLLFLVVNQLTGAIWRSAVIAALFAIHPLQVGTVAWVTERKNVLSGLFWLLTLWAYIRYARQPRAGRYALMLVLFVLGLLSKPVLVTLPAALLLLDIWPLRRFGWARQHLPTASAQGGVDVPAKRSGVIVLEKIPLLLLAVASSLVTILSHEGLGISQASHGLPFGLRIENALVSYVRYLGKIFWPSRLAVLYPHPGEWPEGAVWGSLLLLVLITAIVLWQFRRRPYLFVGWFWFLGVLVPAMGLWQVGIQAMADRFVYLPMIGLLLAVIWWAGDLTARLRITNAALAATAGVLLAGCFIVTSTQLRYWRNSITLWEHTISVTGPNYVAHNNLANALLMAGRLDEALDHALAALRLRPNFAECRVLAGMILEAKVNPDEAIAQYQQAVSLRPTWPLPRKKLADLLARTGKSDSAVEQYTALLQMIPDDPECHRRIADLLTTQKQVIDAIAHYREAIRLDPYQEEAINNLAWIYASNPQSEIRNGKEAVALATRACELTGRKQPLFLGTLAAAYAEAGRFDEAVRTAMEAASVARANGSAEIAATNERLKQLYAEKRTYRDAEPPVSK